MRSYRVLNSMAFGCLVAAFILFVNTVSSRPAVFKAEHDELEEPLIQSESSAFGYSTPND